MFLQPVIPSQVRSDYHTLHISNEELNIYTIFGVFFHQIHRCELVNCANDIDDWCDLVGKNWYFWPVVFDWPLSFASGWAVGGQWSSFDKFNFQCILAEIATSSITNNFLGILIFIVGTRKKSSNWNVITSSWNSLISDFYRMSDDSDSLVAR